MLAATRNGSCTLPRTAFIERDRQILARRVARCGIEEHKHGAFRDGCHGLRALDVRRSGGARRRAWVVRAHRALQLEVCVLQLRAGGVPTHHVELGKDLLVCKRGDTRSFSGGNLEACRAGKRRTLFLLLGQERAVYLRYVVAVHAIILELERVRNVHRTSAVCAEQATKHTRRLAQPLLRLEAETRRNVRRDETTTGKTGAGAARTACSGR